METILETPTYSFVGGNLSIDFTNTVNGRWSGEIQDKFSSYRDLVAWGRQANLLGDKEEQKLLEKAARRPGEAAKALEEATELREVVYRIFLAVAGEHTPAKADMEKFNQKLAAVMTHARIESTQGEFAWGWEESDAFDQVTWPVVRAAADLLASHNLERVKTCGSDDCGWLFVDTSRNGSRRWCDMSDCGNRAKARRHYHRVKAGSR